MGGVCPGRRSASASGERSAVRRGRTGAAADERAPAVEPDAPDVSGELCEEVR